MNARPNVRPPIVAGVAQRHRDGWTIEIDCPYCLTKHRHGGGDGEQPAIVGAWVPHCRDVYYRQRLTFDARLKRHLPNYEIAAPDSDIEWEAEWAYASVLVEWATQEVEKGDRADACAQTAPGRIVNLLAQPPQPPKPEPVAPPSDRNARLLAAWQARRGGTK
jgi:hypothetical protein